MQKTGKGVYTRSCSAGRIRPGFHAEHAMKAVRALVVPR